MVDYEKGSPAWDIGQIMTRHASGPASCCRKVLALLRTRGQAPTVRLLAAHDEPCDCGAGDSMSEHTTERMTATG